LSARLRLCAYAYAFVFPNKVTLPRSRIDPLGRGFLRCGIKIAFIVLLLGSMTSSLWCRHGYTRVALSPALGPSRAGFFLLPDFQNHRLMSTGLGIVESSPDRLYGGIKAITTNCNFALGEHQSFQIRATVSPSKISWSGQRSLLRLPRTAVNYVVSQKSNRGDGRRTAKSASSHGD
jgi:hypothetical protein